MAIDLRIRVFGSSSATKEKTMLYFRGHCYRNTGYYRFVAKLLTNIYKIRSCISSFFCVFFIIIVFSCCSQSAKIESNILCNDSIRCDSFEFAGHSYVEFMQLSDHRFVVLHSPDCSCRYRRTFVVIKRNK